MVLNKTESGGGHFLHTLEMVAKQTGSSLPNRADWVGGLQTGAKTKFKTEAE